MLTPASRGGKAGPEGATEMEPTTTTETPENVLSTRCSVAIPNQGKQQRKTSE